MLGIEVEFAAELYVRHKINPILKSIGFECVYDGTVIDDETRYEGLEIRTLNPFEQFPRYTLTQAISIAEDYGGFITKMSGNHFHMSGYGFLPVQPIRQYLLKNIKYWPERAAFIDWPTVDRNEHKNSPFRCILDPNYVDHYEARIFNSSFDINELEQNFNFTLKMIERFQR